MAFSSVTAVFKRVPLWAYIVLAALLVIVAAVVVPRIITQRKIDAEIAALRAAGWPMTLEELNDSYRKPAGVNAADTLTSAFLQYGNLKSDGVPIVGVALLPEHGEPLAPEMKAKIGAYLAANEAALQLLHKGAAISDCRWPIDLRDGMSVLMPHLAPLRQGARLLRLEAEIHADDNKPDEAAGAIAASLGLARSLQNEPFVVSQELRSAVHEISAHALARVLSKVPLSEARMRELSSLIETEEDPGGFERSLAGEACFQIDAFEKYSASPLQISNMGEQSKLDIFLYIISGSMQRDQLAYLRFMHKVIPEARLRPSAMISEMRLRTAEIRSLAKRSAKVSVLKWMGQIVPSEAVARVQSLASLRLMRTALAVERFRLAHGKLPQKLDELVPGFLPEIPADPFDDKPLRYLRREKGYMIYSVGENRKDEGGDNRHIGEPPWPDDIPFTVER